jgi:hypothetical protein
MDSGWEDSRGLYIPKFVLTACCPLDDVTGGSFVFFLRFLAIYMVKSPRCVELFRPSGSLCTHIDLPSANGAEQGCRRQMPLPPPVLVRPATLQVIWDGRPNGDGISGGHDGHVVPRYQYYWQYTSRDNVPTAVKMQRFDPGYLV